MEDVLHEKRKRGCAAKLLKHKPTYGEANELLL